MHYLLNNIAISIVDFYIQTSAPFENLVVHLVEPICTRTNTQEVRMNIHTYICIEAQKYSAQKYVNIYISVVYTLCTM